MPTFLFYRLIISSGCNCTPFYPPPPDAHAFKSALVNWRLASICFCARGKHQNWVIITRDIYLTHLTILIKQFRVNCGSGLISLTSRGRYKTLVRCYYYALYNVQARSELLGAAADCQMSSFHLGDRERNVVTPGCAPLLTITPMQETMVLPLPFAGLPSSIRQQYLVFC